MLEFAGVPPKPKMLQADDAGRVNMYDGATHKLSRPASKEASLQPGLKSCSGAVVEMSTKKQQAKCAGRSAHLTVRSGIGYTDVIWHQTARSAKGTTPLFLPDVDISLVCLVV